MHTRMKCLDNKKEIFNNKRYYAKLFSEGRESLERLLLTSYENGTMTRACCAGHTDEKITTSYVYFRSDKKDLKLFSSISEYINNTDLREYCVSLEESKFGLKDLNKYFLGIYVAYDKADLVYDAITELIKNNKNNTVTTEYETVKALKQSLLSLRSILSDPLSFSSVQAEQIKNNIFNMDIETGNHLSIHKKWPDESDYISKPMDVLIKKVYDGKLSVTDLVGTYTYEDKKQLKELQRVLKR